MAARSTPPLSWSVIGTLAWFGLRGRPLTLRELSRLLLRNEADEVAVRGVAEEDSRVVKHDGFYSLEGDEVRYPTDAALKNYRYKWWRLRVTIGILRHIPFVRLVGALQTMGDRTATAPHDIDVFIVTERGRLFITRSLITLVLQLAGLRRHGTKVANRICLSWYATTDHLDMSPVAYKPYDILLFYLFAEMIPVLNTDGTYEKFVSANTWIGSFVPAYRPMTVPSSDLSRFARLGERVLGGRVGDFLEKRLSSWQLGRISRHPGSPDPDVEIVASDRMLKFHEKERRRVDRERWEARVRGLGGNPDIVAK